jgi:hypothetical protein
MGYGPERTRINAAVERLTGAKFCQSCQKEQLADGGTHITKKNRKFGWRCKYCTQRKAEHEAKMGLPALG